MRMTKYEQGWPAWADLATPDVRWMLSFYGALFGWRDEPQPGGAGLEYHVQLLGDAPVAAIYQQPREESRRGVPPYWNVHLTVDDVDAAATQVIEAGGKLLSLPADIGDGGRMTRIADPSGAAVVLWQPRIRNGASVIREPGAMSWCELQTGNPDRAAAFLRTLLGVEAVSREASPGVPYTVIQVRGEDVAGIRRTPQYLPAQWLPYFEVEDVDDAVTAAVPKGGNVLTPPRDDVLGRVATLQDPQGAVFGLMTAAR